MSERLHRLVMQSFRGVPGTMTVDFGAGQSIAVYGDNGTGKSTIADALEWYFTGEIELLSHEGRQHAICSLGGEKGALTSVAVETNGALGGTIVFPSEKKADASQAAGRETFLLRGRTLADFINKTKTEKWKSLVEILRLDDVESLREDLQKARNELRKQAKAAEEHVKSCRAAVGSEGEAPTEETVLSNLRQICAMLGVDPPGTLTDALEPRWLTAVAGVPATPPSDRDGFLAEIETLQVPSVDPNVLEAWNELVASERARVLPRASLLQEAKRLLETTTLDGHCPLCGAAVDEEDLSRKIEASVLSMLDATRELETCRESIRQILERLRAAGDKRQSLERRGKKLQIDLPPVPALREDGVAASIDALANVPVEPIVEYESHLRKWDQSARDVCRASAPSTPATRESQLLMLATLCEHIKAWRVAEKKASEAARALDLAEQVFEGYQAKQKEDVTAILARISERVASLYAALHPDEDLGSVSIEPWTAKGVELAIDFYGSHQRPPHGVLSESHLNSLAIALFLAMAETFNEKLRFLVLDDVINSFDREHRSQLADLLATEFSDWQLVVLTHDHQFYDHLTRRAPSWRRLELTSWSYGEGPRTTGYEMSGILAAARELLERGDVNGAAAKARRALEEQLQEVCVALQAPLAFRRGHANDQREIGELFRGLRRALKEHAKSLLDSLEPSFKSLEADVQATLNVEVHASQGRSGASEVGAALTRIEELNRRWTCAACGTRIWHKGSAEAARCKCGKSAFPPVPAA